MSLLLLAQAQTLNRFETAFVRLVDGALASPLLGVAAIAVALAVGAVHALAPGHGKAIAAAYLVGGRGRPRDAVALGVAVAAMHTASVLVLGLGLQLALRPGSGGLPALTEQVTPWLRVASGVMVLAVGIHLLVRVRARHRAHTHAHAPAAAATSPFSRRGLVTLGAAGGLLPSPSAFLVLTTTAFMGRLWFGLLLVAVFSVGLAATLTAVGLAAVRGRQALTDRVSDAARLRLLRLASTGGAVVVLLGGIVLTVAGARAL
jgi:ABC-type nickel/cobalt efflux system permease component RcnA